VPQGRKSRRERRAFKERRMKDRLPSPPRSDQDDYIIGDDGCECVMVSMMMMMMTMMMSVAGVNLQIERTSVFTRVDI